MDAMRGVAQNKPMRCAIYARVSSKEKSPCPGCRRTVRVVEGRLKPHAGCAWSGRPVEADADKGQDTDNQLIQLREYCSRQGWEIVTEFVDRETAKHGQRDEFKAMFEAASRRQFDVVLVWALDRFTREGVYQTFDYVRRLSLYGVLFESYSESHFRTTGPAGELMLAVAAWIAQQERIRISDRTKAGLVRARSQGKKCGRPVKVFRRDEAADMRKRGLSWRTIEKALGVPQSTIRLALAGVQKT